MADKSYQIAFNAEAVAESFYGDVVSLIVEENTDTASILRLRLVIRLQDDGTWTYLDDSRFAPFTKVSIGVGFTGGSVPGLPGGSSSLEPVFDGYITAVQLNFASQPGSTFLEINGMDSSVLMSLEEKIATWPNLADSDIVQQIVSSYGVQVQADATSTVHQENVTTITQRGTDIQLVRNLAQRNGFEFYFETDKDSKAITAHFQAPQLDGTPQSDLAIQFGGTSNLRSLTARLAGQRPLNVKVVQMDVQANSPNSAQVFNTQLTKLGASDLNMLVGGPLGSLVTPKDALAQMLAMGAPTSDSTELQTLAQAMRDEAGWFITANGEINSDAYQAVLRPHRTVLIKGAGAQYSGKYYVTQVTHELQGSGSYVQRFVARRNARDLDGSEQFASNGSGLLSAL